MKIQMKQLELWCTEFAERWNKPTMWEFYCLAKDCWLSGYQKAREESIKVMTVDCPIMGQKLVPPGLFNLGEELIEVEITSNQIGQGKDLKFNVEAFKTDMLRHYLCDNLVVHVSDKGVVSFQGTFKK